MTTSELLERASARHWYVTGSHVQSAVRDENNYICEAEGDTVEQAQANAELIVRAVNSFEVMREALANILADCERAEETLSVASADFAVTHAISYAREALALADGQPEAGQAGGV
jgi:hypothetical protein